jgi:hypothetical protein
MMKKNCLKLLPILALAAFASCASKKAVSDAALPATTRSEAKAATATTPTSTNVEQTTFLQTVNDNQVYAKDIVADASFKIEMGSKDVSCDGQLRMRRDKIIRLQLLLPIIHTEIARVDFTPDHVLLVDRYHKEYIEADYSQVSFLADNGITFYSLQALFWNQLFAPGEQTVTRQMLKQFAADLTSSANTVPVTLKKGQINYQWDAEKSSGRIVKTTATYDSQAHGKSQLVWNYADFRALGVKMFPAQQQFTFETGATGKTQKGTVSVTMGTLKTSSDWDATTTLSAKYKKIEAQDILKKITSLQ